MLTILAVLAVAHWSPHGNESWGATWQSGLSRAIFLIGILGALGIFIQVRPAYLKIVTGLIVLLLAGFDAVTHTPRQNPVVHTESFGPLQLQMKPVPKAWQSRAMLSRNTQLFFGKAATPKADNNFIAARASLYANCNLLEQVPKVNGFFSLYLREEAQIRNQLYSPTNFPAPLADFLGVSQISSEDSMLQWNFRPAFLPLVTAGQKPTFASPEETLKALASPKFNPRRDVYLPPEARKFLSATNFGEATIRAQKFSAHRIEFQVEADKPSLVTVAQSFYHCWHAEIDGKPARLLRANHAFQALEVGAGTHEVKLIYRDRNFYAGGMISAASLMICAMSWRRARRSNHG